MAILTRSSALIDRGHRVHRSTREDRVKFPFFAAEKDLLARVQSSFVQSDSFWADLAAARLPVRLASGPEGEAPLD